MIMTDEQRAALNVVQAAFLQTHRHAQEVALATLEGQRLGLRNARMQNVMASASRNRLWAWLSDGYFTGLEVALSKDYDLTLQKMAALRASIAAHVTLRGVGLHHDGTLVYWFHYGDDEEPQCFEVTHDVAGVLLPVLRQTKVWLHETYRQSTAADRSFPISWGLMMDDNAPVLVAGHPRKGTDAYDYSVSPMANVFTAHNAA